jgi:hypothetical protein
LGYILGDFLTNPAGHPFQAGDLLALFFPWFTMEVVFSI